MYIDNFWQGSPNAVRSSEIREQWLAAAAGLCFAVALSACAGFFFSISKCDLIPTLLFQYLGLMCDSGRVVFRVPSDKLCRPRDHMRQVLVYGVVLLSTLKQITGKCMSINIAIRPEFLWTHDMFEAKV